MARKTVIQTLLVAVLVVTAHTIKPFSVGNVTLQALGTARSFSFIMPAAAVERIEHANYLAQTFGKGLFEGDEGGRIWTRENVMRSGLVAFDSPVSSFASYDAGDNAEIRDLKPSDTTRKSAPKRPARRIKSDAGRDDNRDEDADCTKSTEIAKLPELSTVETIAMVQPISLPVYQFRKPMAIKANFIPGPASTQVDHLIKLGDCAQVEVRTVKLIAFVPAANKMRIELMMLAKPVTVTTSCREEDEVEAEEEAHTTIGPEEELFFSEPAPAAPFMATPAPECIRIP